MDVDKLIHIARDNESENCFGTMMDVDKLIPPSEQNNVTREFWDYDGC